MIDTAVVILNYNGLEFLKRFLPPLVRYTTNARIIVADNASTDNSVKFIKEAFESVEIIEIEKNLGFSGGYNYALKKIDTSYYVLINSDVEVTPDWLEPLLAPMRTDSSVAACQPKIMDYSIRDQFEYAGAAGGFIDRLGYPFCRGRIFETVEQDIGQYDDQAEIFWACGACLAIRSEVYHSMGGLDEDFFAHMEEIDLCWRIQRAAKKILYIPGSKVFHVGGGTLKKSNPFKTYLNFRNGLAMLYKNGDSPSLYGKLFLRLILDGVAALKFLFFDSPSHFLAIIKAHFHFYSNIPKLRSQRKALKTQVKMKNLSIKGIYKNLIVWQYYGKRKKRYYDLPGID